MTVIGTTYIDVEPRTDGFEKGVMSKVSSVAKLAAGAFAAAFVIKEGVGFAAGLVKDAEEAQKVAKQTEAAIKSTGGAAKVSAGQVADLAAAISRKTGIDDEAIQSGQNLLLTFTGVRNEVGKGNDIFNRATKTLVDMGAAMKSGPSGSAIQLGKALNDPIKGITALTRVGVTFSEQQKKQIEGFVKAGQAAKAQSVILDELDKEFGGSAEAQATGTAKLAVAWGNLREDLGAKLLPVVEKVTTFLADNLPAAMDKIGPVIDQVGKQITAAFIAAEPFIANVVTVLREQVLPVVQDLASWIGDHLQPTLVGLGVAFLALTSPVSLAVAAFVAAYTQLDGFRELVDKSVKFLVKTFGDLQAAVATRMAAVQEAIKHVVAVVQAAWSVWGDNLLRIAKAVFDQIVNVVQTAVRVVRDVIDVVLAVINGDWGKAWKALADIPAAMLGFVITTVQNSLRVVGNVVSAALEGLQRLWSVAWRNLQNLAESAFQGVLNFVAGIPARILATLGDLTGLLGNVGKDIVDGLVHGIQGAAHRVIDAAKKLANLLPSWVRKVLHISSPSRVFFEIGEYSIEGLVQGIVSKQTKAQKAAATLAKKVGDATKDALQAALSGVGDLFSGLSAVQGRTAAQTKVVQAGDALQLAIAQRDALPAKIVAARAALEAAQGKAVAQTPAELRAIAGAEDDLAAAQQAQAAAQAELNRLQTKAGPTTAQQLALLQAQDKAVKSAAAATDALAAAKADANNPQLQRDAAIAQAQAAIDAEEAKAAVKAATDANGQLAAAARAVYEANLDVQISQLALNESIKDSTDLDSASADAKQTLDDLLTEQAESTKAVTDAQTALNAAKLDAIQAELAYVDAQQKLQGLAPGVLQFFRDLAKNAGLSDDAINTLVGTLGKLKSGAPSDKLAPTPSAALINTVTGRKAYTGPEGEAGSASREAIEAYARANGINPANTRSFTIGGTTSYYLPGVAIDPGNVAALANLPQYASGGATKAGEWSIAGENGPELWRRGAAGQFYDAKTTAAALAGATAPMPSVTFGERSVVVETFDVSRLAAQLGVTQAIGKAVAMSARLHATTP